MSRRMAKFMVLAPRLKCKMTKKVMDASLVKSLPHYVSFKRMHLRRRSLANELTSKSETKDFHYTKNSCR